MARSIVPIDDDDCLYRRLVPDHLYPDGNVNSNAFKLKGKPDASVSVDLAKLTTPDESIARGDRRDTMLGVLVARDVRALGLTVRHEPNDENPAHAVIEGNTSRSMCRKLAAITRGQQS